MDSKQLLIDHTDKVICYKQADEVRLAIYNRVKVLEDELTAFMLEVSGELTGLAPEDIAALLVSIHLPGNQLSPKALLVKMSLDRAVAITEEVKFLTYVVNNLNENATYRLDVGLLARYGFILPA